MKKIILALATVVLALNANAQTAKSDWYNASFEKDGVYGAEVDKAYEFLGKRKATYNPVVAIIGTGIDVQHEALASKLWVNKKEKADGIDNDGNGLVDDINGWNFIGQKDGGTLANVMKEGDRGWLLMKEKYANIKNIDGVWLQYGDDGKGKNIPAPANLEEYEYFKRCANESKIGGLYSSYIFCLYMNEVALDLFDRMKTRYPGRKLTAEDFNAVVTDDGLLQKGSTYVSALNIMAMGINTRKSKITDPSVDYMADAERVFTENKMVDKNKEKYDAAVPKFVAGQREEKVGDNPYDINDKKYGNNTLMTINANPSTLIATLITGERGIEGRNNPICPEARIMPLVVVDQEGEPYAKDLALSVRYAVDNGADIVCFTAPNSLCPESQKAWLDDAVKYAESKGVLVVLNSFNNGDNWDAKKYYPSRFTDAGKEFTNVMVVAPSTAKGEPVSRSSYGAKTIDLFAPGENLLGGIVGDAYKTGSGSILSMGVTAGVAALLKAHYPTLTAAQIRTILNETVTSRAGLEVEKEYRGPNNKAITDMFLFDDLCQSKGIINAYKAVQAADKVK